MIQGRFFTLTLLAALGSGLTAGVLFAFSAFVMQGLNRLPAAEGLRAMQSINAAALNPLFMAALFGPALAAAVLAVRALSRWDEPYAGYLLAGSVLYLVGVIVVTVVYHVPRNDALATVGPTSVDAPRHWTAYVRGWTAWNHVRAAAALAATVTFILALRVGAAPEA